MVPVLSRIRLVALFLAVGLAATVAGCKSSSCAKNSSACCSPAPCAPTPCQPACASPCGTHHGLHHAVQKVLEKPTAGTCDCAPHNPLDPYNRCGVPTTPPTPVRVVTPTVTGPALPGTVITGTPGLPAATNPIIGTPLPPIGTVPEPVKESPMQKDMGMKKEK